MHLPKTNFIVDLLLTCLFGFVALRCVAFRIVSICFVFCFMFYVLCVLLGCPCGCGETPLEKGEASAEVANENVCAIQLLPSLL